jgi:hypothetical protein
MDVISCSKTIKVMAEQNLTIKGKADEPYSIIRAIKQKLEGQEPEGIYKEMNERGKAEWPSSIGTKSNAIYIPMQNTDNAILNTLCNMLFLTRAGATIRAGLKSNIPIHSVLPPTPVFMSPWEAENEEIPNVSGDLKYFRPHHLFTSHIYVPKQLFDPEDLVSDRDVLVSESRRCSYLIETIARALDGVVLGNGQATDKQPSGLFNGVTNTVEMSWTEIVNLTTSMDVANAFGKNCSYVMHEDLYDAAKAISPTGSFVNGLYDGYRVFSPKNVYADPANGKYGILFGSFKDLLIEQWGSLELVVAERPLKDDVKLSKSKEEKEAKAIVSPLKNNVKLSISFYWNAGLRRDGVMSKALFTIPAGKPVA